MRKHLEDALEPDCGPEDLPNTSPIAAIAKVGRCLWLTDAPPGSPSTPEQAAQP